MFKGQSSCFKYIYVPTNNISSWSASNRRTIFTRRADTEHRKVSDIPRRNLKTNGFQNRRAAVRATVNLSKEECIKVVPPLL
jgi:hypothetical protein